MAERTASFAQSLMIERMIVFCCLATSLSAADPGNAPLAERAELLMQARKQVEGSFQHLPRYICTETVDRSVFMVDDRKRNGSCSEVPDKRKDRLRESDRLRLDVAISSEGEMFSWVGENSFHDGSVAEWVGQGAISSGAFGSFLESIFEGDAASFTDAGNVSEDGRTLAKFGFHVPLEKSSYRIATKNFRTLVPFDGSFLVDPKTSDLVRLTVHADRLPKELEMCQVTTTISYGEAKVSRYEILLPASARLQVTDQAGDESDNETSFSSCHEFQTESKLSFGDSATAGLVATSHSAPQPPALPFGLRFGMVLTDPITSAAAAAGDTIRARLTTPLREQDGTILAAKAATITGRITRFERFYRPVAMAVIGIRLETIEVNGVRQPFHARFNWMINGATVSQHGPHAFSNPQLELFAQLSGAGDPAVSFLIFENAGKNYVVPKGLKLEGTTLAASKR